MPLRCIAVDDEPPALALLREYCSRVPDLQLLHSFDDAVAGQSFLLQHPVDLLFVDINMPDIGGMELVRSLQEKPLVIFTTAHKQFALDGFELDALDYLLKPISFERFSKAAAKAVEYFSFRNKNKAPEPEHLIVYSEYRMVKIPLDDIEYIESLEDYVRIHLSRGKPVMTLATLKKIQEKLPGDRFRRIHRSYIVATDKVQSVGNRKATLVSAVRLPISDSYADFINEWKKA